MREGWLLGHALGHAADPTASASAQVWDALATRQVAADLQAAMELEVPVLALPGRKR